MEEPGTESGGGHYTPPGLVDALLELWGKSSKVSRRSLLVSHLEGTAGANDFLLDTFFGVKTYRSVRLESAAYGMRMATTADERREAVREFLSALAELIACLIGFVVRLLLLLLSGLLGRATASDVTVWAPLPLERTPEITPRGPNHAVPVSTNRGGHRFSCALGNAVLAA